MAMIQSEALSSEELAKIEDEWSDSTVVKSLLGHIQYLTDAIIRQQGEQKGEDRGS